MLIVKVCIVIKQVGYFDDYLTLISSLDSSSACCRELDEEEVESLCE